MLLTNFPTDFSKLAIPWQKIYSACILPSLLELSVTLTPEFVFILVTKKTWFEGNLDYWYSYFFLFDLCTCMSWWEAEKLIWMWCGHRKKYNERDLEPFFVGKRLRRCMFWKWGSPFVKSHAHLLIQQVLLEHLLYFGYSAGYWKCTLWLQDGLQQNNGPLWACVSVNYI